MPIQLPCPVCSPLGRKPAATLRVLAALVPALAVAAASVGFGPGSTAGLAGDSSTAQLSCIGPEARGIEEE